MKSLRISMVTNCPGQMVFLCLFSNLAGRFSNQILQLCFSISLLKVSLKKILNVNLHYSHSKKTAIVSQGLSPY